MAFDTHAHTHQQKKKTDHGGAAGGRLPRRARARGEEASGNESWLPPPSPPPNPLPPQHTHTNPPSTNTPKTTNTVPGSLRLLPPRGLGRALGPAQLPRAPLLEAGELPEDDGRGPRARRGGGFVGVLLACVYVCGFGGWTGGEGEVLLIYKSVYVCRCVRI